MRVAWDARVIFAPQLRGMGAYAMNLVRAIGCVRPDISRILLTDEVSVAPNRVDGVTPVIVGPSRGYRWRLWEQLGLPWHTARLRVDLLHSPANTAPLVARTPRVVTVHDVIPYLPEIADGPLAGHYWRRLVPAAIRGAAAVLTDSEASRSDIMRVFDVPSDRIHVIPLAVGADVQPRDADAVHAMLLTHGVRQPYIYSLAAAARRKNTLGVLRVFARLARAVPDAQLVLTGAGATYRDELIAAAVALGIPESRMRLFGYADPATRNVLYTGATVFLFLSLYEGFGLPILEAMRCGAPVLCSTRASCPEVAGAAAVMVDPADEEGAAAALADMIRASSTQRAEWRAGGMAREREFTWTRTARMTLDVYDAVAR